MLEFKFSLLRLSIRLNKSLFCSQYANYIGKINTVAKRGSMLKDMIKNRDKRKNWLLNLNVVSTKPKARVFDKIHKPFRRRAVLNSLFITNITDVLSTGDVAPDLINYGIEITGVSVTPCMKILNVFWTLPPSKYDSCDDVGKILAISAPKIRAELISRNVLGRVPHIFFLRDATNERISEYEKAAKIVELELKNEDTSVVPDESFADELYSFKEYRKSNVCKERERLQKLVKVEVKKEEPKEEPAAIPYKPIDMKNDACGLDYKLLIDKVNAMRKRKKDPLQHTNVISPDTLKSSDDLFSNIPGVCFQAGSDEEESRDVILKQFRIGRKMLKEKYKDKSGDLQCYDTVEVDEKESNRVEDNDDFIDEDETGDNRR